MYGSPEDGSIDEASLSCILKTALGVSELTVTDLFQAIDQEEKGRITFGKWSRVVSPPRGVVGTPAHACKREHGLRRPRDVNGTPSPSPHPKLPPPHLTLDPLKKVLLKPRKIR